MDGINSAKVFSSPSAMVRAKESRALRPDCVHSSSFPVRHDLTLSRVRRTGEDEELRTSSDSFRLRSASKFNAPDLICVVIRGLAGRNCSSETHSLILDARQQGRHTRNKLARRYDT